MTANLAATVAAAMYGAGAAVLLRVRSWRHRRVTGHSGSTGRFPRDGLGWSSPAAGFWLARRSQDAMGQSWRIGGGEGERTDSVTDGVRGGPESLTSPP